MTDSSKPEAIGVSVTFFAAAVKQLKEQYGDRVMTPNATSATNVNEFLQYLGGAERAFRRMEKAPSADGRRAMGFATGGKASGADAS